MSRTWLITGASRGFGRQWTTAALERGDRVAATARDTATLDDLVGRFGDRILALSLDVTDREAAFTAAGQAHERFGRLDVVVNNAGYGQFGMIEELTEQEARSQLETNFFGALWVTQAVLPILRAQRSGHLLQVSSVGGVTAMANVGIYNASKWALEGLSQALAEEVADLGVKVTLLEPGGYATDWGRSSAKHAVPNPAYEEVRTRAASRFRRRPASSHFRQGDPVATREAVLALVDAEDPPLRVFLGEAPLSIVSRDYESRLATWLEWQTLSVAAQGST